MRRILPVLVLFAGTALAGSAQAQNYPWCAQYTGNMGGAMNCGFSSYDQCMMTARGMGAFCIQNTLYQPPGGPKPSGSKPRRHHSQ